MNSFYNINIKLPPIGVEVEVKNNNKVTKDILIKVEWIDQKVVYTWAKNNAYYLEWKPIY